VKVFEGLVEELSLSTALQTGLQLYVFGSATKLGATPNDVDLLLVYADGLFDDAHAFAEEIRSTLTAPPYDVLVASEREAAQLNLVAKQEAVLIWPTSPDRT
jgi:hypothetical protein